MSRTVQQLFLENPESISLLLDLLEKFERCSGLKINHMKSEAMWLRKWKLGKWRLLML